MISKSWEQYHTDIKQLVVNLGDYRPDILVPCMIGGLLPGAIMAKELGVNDVRPIDMERVGDERRLVYDIQGDIKGKNILLIEDDLPTGKGPVMAKHMFESRGARVKIASVYVTSKTNEIADFYTEVIDEPIGYPWKKYHNGDRVRTQ